jgi:hypothetical protein
MVIYRKERDRNPPGGIVCLQRKSTISLQKEVVEKN